MTKSKPYSLSIHELKIELPAINTNTATQLKGYYNHEFFFNFLSNIISSGNNKYRDGQNYFCLVSIKQSSDADIYEGKIHTTKYGTLNDIIDTDTDAIVNQLYPKQGVKNEINFVLNSKTGHMLVQNDPFRILTRNFLFKFLLDRENLAKPSIEKFNKNNKPLSLFDKNSFNLLTIYDKGFYDQLAKIANVKSVSINTIVEKSQVNGALNHFSRTNSNEDEYLDNINEMVYTFKNTHRSNGVTKIRSFIENALDMEKIQSLEAHGYNNGKPLTAAFAIKPQSYTIKTTKNKEGILDQSKIINEMINLSKKLEI